MTIGILGKPQDIPKIKKLINLLKEVSKDIVVVMDSKNKKDLFVSRNTHVFLRPLENDFSAQRNFILKKAKDDWVFFIDSDELPTAGFVRKLKKISQNSGGYNGYYLKRAEVFMGKRLLHGESENLLLRLGNKKMGEWVRDFHETWKIEGETGVIKPLLLHFAYEEGVGKFLEKLRYYARMRAIELQKERGGSIFWLIVKPPLKFIYNAIFQLGFLDGIPGLVHAACMAYYSLSVELLAFDKSLQS